MNHYLLQFAALLSTGTGANQLNYQGPKSDSGLMSHVLMPIYFWASVIAVIVIIVSGFLYVFSNGNPQQITRARNAILGAVVGLIVVLIAFGLTSMILKGVS